MWCSRTDLAYRLLVSPIFLLSLLVKEVRQEESLPHLSFSSCSFPPCVCVGDGFPSPTATLGGEGRGERGGTKNDVHVPLPSVVEAGDTMMMMRVLLGRLLVGELR
jgi:hypothetical protein